VTAGNAAQIRARHPVPTGEEQGGGGVAVRPAARERTGGTSVRRFSLTGRRIAPENAPVQGIAVEAAGKRARLVMRTCK